MAAIRRYPYIGCSWAYSRTSAIVAASSARGRLRYRAEERSRPTNRQARRGVCPRSVIRHATALRLARGRTIFCSHLFQRVDIQGLLRHNVLQSAVFCFQLPQPLQLTGVHSSVLAPPPIDRLLCYPILSADLGHTRSTFTLFQDTNDLFLALPRSPAGHENSLHCFMVFSYSHSLWWSFWGDRSSYDGPFDRYRQAVVNVVTGRTVALDDRGRLRKEEDLLGARLSPGGSLVAYWVTGDDLHRELPARLCLQQLHLESLLVAKQSLANLFLESVGQQREK
jgi:hypothetical protein